MKEETKIKIKLRCCLTSVFVINQEDTTLVSAIENRHVVQLRPAARLRAGLAGQRPAHFLPGPANQAALFLCDNQYVINKTTCLVFLFLPIVINI